MAIIKRITKGSPLTHEELDGNFTDLDGRVTDNTFTPIAENAFGTHPAFNTQAELFQYMLENLQTGTTPPSSYTEGDNGVVADATVLGTDTMYWTGVHKASDFPMFTFSKAYFIIWSTDHAQTSGGLYWAECDDLLLTNLTYGGLIYTGNQSETPRLLNDSGTARIYFHTGTSDPANVPSQSSHVIKTTGGAGQTMTSATWTRVDNVLGQFNDDNHTGYMHPEKRGASDWIALHLGKSTIPRKYYLSNSTDGETWARVKEVNQFVNPDGRVTYFPEPFTYNSINYGIGTSADPNDDSIDYIGLYELDNDNIPTRFVGYISSTPENIRETIYDVEVKDGYLFIYYCIGDEVNFSSTTKLWLMDVTKLNIGITLNSPSEGVTFNDGDNITLSTTITGTPTKVEFFNGGTKLGENTSAPFGDFTINAASAGSYSFYAKATYATGFTKVTEEHAVSVQSASLTYILDSYPMHLAFSTRKLGSAYSGNAVELEETGGSRLVIGYNGDNIDEAAILSFSGDARIRQFVNQGSAGVNVTNTAFAGQPTISSGGAVTKVNGKPFLTFNGFRKLEASSLNISRLGTDFTLMAVAVNNNDAEVGIIAGDWISGGRVGLQLNTNTDAFAVNGPQGNFDSVAKSTPIAQGTLYLITIVREGSEIRGYVNGVLQGTDTVTDNTFTGSSQFGIGEAGFSSGALNGSIAEVLGTKSALSDTARAEIEQNIKDYYGIA